jgi:aspartate-semialdehyde dehydrogenase
VPDDDTPPQPARLALVGAASLLGKEIKDQLAASGFPGEQLALFDLEEVAGVLTDYGEEARVFAETVTERVLQHELACFCGDPADAADVLAPLLDAGRLGLDCTGAWLADERAFPWIPGASTPPALESNRAVAVPPGAALLLGRTVASLGELAAGASSNVFIPATERGDAGLEELSQQSTAVLNLLDVDLDVFGRQQAFDVWLPHAESPLCDARLAAALERMELPASAINVVSAPVFHGIALSTFVPGASAAQVSAALLEGGFEQAGGDKPVDSPVRAVGRGGLHALQVRDDAAGAWIWVVADNLHARAAAAVAAIHTMLGLGVSDALQ